SRMDSAAEDGHAGHRFFNALQAPAVLRQCYPRTFDLAWPGLAAQLGHEFMDLPEAGGPDRMALGFQPARRVDRNAAADLRLAPLAQGPALAELAEPQVLDLDDLAHGGRIVDFGDRHVLRSHASALIGAPGGDRRAVLVDPCWIAIGPGVDDAGEDPDGATGVEAEPAQAGRGTEHHRRGAIG